MITHKYSSAAAFLWSAFFCVDVVRSQVQTVPAELDSVRRRIESMRAPPASNLPSKDASLQIETQSLGLWSALKPGMTEGEVQSLLGKPDRIEDRAQATRWYWNKGETRGGWVSFDQESHKVIAWGNL
jgi:hypothetical protein